MRYKSASSTSTDAYQAGASGFIGKPYKSSDLARRVRRILDGVPV